MYEVDRFISNVFFFLLVITILLNIVPKKSVKRSYQSLMSAAKAEAFLLQRTRRKILNRRAKNVFPMNTHRFAF